MKFKLFSLVLLLVCFALLGVLSGVIPVTDRDAVQVFRQVLDPDGSPVAEDARPSATPRAVVPPTPRLAGTAAPISTAVIAAPTAVPVTATPAPARRTVSVSQSPSPSPENTAPSSPAPSAAGGEDEPEPLPVTAAPTRTPAPSAEPTATPAAVVHGWEPEAEVVATTITWQDPVRNDTDIDLQDISLPEQEGLPITLPDHGAQILIIHTHGTEAYTPDGEDQYEATADYRTIDPGHTVIRVGQALAQALENYGLRVVVDTELYDWPSYNGSYGRAEQAIRQYLEQDPDIAMIIDLHRDALGTDEVMYKTVSDELDESAAQLMFVVGTDENLEHPNWRQNLAFALSLQELVEEKYPHLTRPTLVCPYRYNQQFTPGSILLEIGTAGNTLQEAITAAELFADAVGPALAGQTDE